VPERVAPELLKEYEQLRGEWTSGTEIKGSSLSDDQTAAALAILGRYDVMAEIVALDVGHNSLKQIERFRRDQGEAFLAGLTPQHNANARKWARAIREEWLQLPPQLIVQMYVLILTVEEVIRMAPNYYAQRMPDELARFDWILDPKDIKPTPFEMVWQKIVCPVLQTMSLEKPWWRVREFDYAAFSRFDMEMPDYIRPHVRQVRAGSDQCVNLAMLLRESVAFPNSKDDSGLQLVDIVASAFTKAMNGKLPPPVWRLLGPLMVERPNSTPTAQLVALGTGPRIEVGKYHRYVLTALRNRAKKLFVTTARPG
jgi:hypothetical protein